MRLFGEHVKNYILAGNATVTLLRGKTEKSFTYTIKRSNNDEYLYFVNLVCEPDNLLNYKYIGCYYADTKHFHAAKMWKDKHPNGWPPALRAIKYLFDHLQKVPDILEVYHNGHCGRCGRRLTTPESIECGLGPECYKMKG